MPNLLTALTALLPVLTSASPLSVFQRNTSSTPILNSNTNDISRTLPSDVRAYIQETLDFWRIPGAVVAFVSEERQGVEVFGIKDVKGTPMDADTYLSIGSNTKWITALALATLEVWGNVTLPNGEIFTLDSKLKDIYPEFSMQDPNAASRATVADFLTMRTGVPRHDLSISRNDSALDALRNIGLVNASLPFPTDIQQYSTLHYNALTALPELLLNQKLETFVQNTFWTQLGINATFNATQAELTGKRGQAFNVVDQNLTSCALALAAEGKYNETQGCRGGVDVFDYWTEGDGLEQGGGGAVLMTGNDLLRWVKESLRPSVIPQKALDIAYNRYAIPATATIPNLTYSAGVNNILVGDFNASFHSGAVPGHNSAFWRDVQGGQGVFAIVNQDPSGFQVVDSLALQVLRSLKGLKPENQNDELLSQIYGGVLPVGNSTNSTGGLSTPTGAGRRSLEEFGDPFEARWVNDGSRSAISPRVAPASVNLTGTFTSPGYSPLSFTRINASDPSALISVGISPRIIAQAQGIPLTDTYVAKWNSSFTTHVILIHYDGPYYNYSVIKSLPKIGELTNTDQISLNWTAGSAKGDVFTTKYFNIGPAVVDEGGIGMYGTWWGSDALRYPEVNVADVRGTAQTYFTRR